MINSVSPNIFFVSDVFEQCDTIVVEAINAAVERLSSYYTTQRLQLASITEKQIDCNWLFEHSAYLLSAEIWNTFGAWVAATKPELSSIVRYSLENRAKSINRKDVQKWVMGRHLFSMKLNAFLNKGNLLCFPTTPTLAPKIEEIIPEFLTEGDYYPKNMGINAIAGLSSTPQVTIPFVLSNGVPVGLSFLAAYGQDAMLVKFCCDFYRKATG